MKTQTEIDKDWRTEPCFTCGGHGIVSLYSMYDFEGPGECRDCNGSGYYWIHKKSGVIAAWPGGPFLGKLTKKEKNE